MVFSLNILKTLVDLENIDISYLKERLTFSGFEVEDVKFNKKIDNLAIGLVTECIDHPDSDHLHLLKVDIGNEVLDIVCGAKNVKKGVKVILAMVNCVLPNNVVIKESTIRGYKSYGMCCSLKELNIDDSYYPDDIKNGIFICDEKVEIGKQDVFKTLGFDDVYLDINVLANRSDCLSYYGMAKEIASLVDRKLLIDDKLYNFEKLPLKINCKSATSRCQKLDFVELQIDENKTSPQWLQEILRKCNVNSISCLVDIGNFVMKMTGQPIHVYDLDKIGKYKNIIVRDDVETTFKALDKKDYQIQKNDLCVMFDDNVECLGGIMGGEHCACDENSKHVLIEAANFFHQNIRLTSKRLNLISDSSTLFVKKVNPYLTKEALTLFINTCKLVFKKVKVVSISSYSKLKPFKNKIPFSISKLNNRLGSNYSYEEVEKALSSLRIKLFKNYVIVPIDRIDLVEQCDIEEEVFRFYMAKNINLTLDKMPITVGSLTDEQHNIKKLHTRLTNLGLDQIVCFTLISKQQHELVQVFKQEEPFIVSNPMTADHEYVRTDLLPSMIETLNYNVNHRHTDLALYEISNVDTKNGVKDLLSVGLANFKFNRDKLEFHKFDFYDMKGVFESVMDVYKIEPNRYVLKPSSNDFFHKGISADVFINNKLVGTFGLVSPKITLVKPYFLMELNLSSLQEVRVNQQKMKPISSYPKVSRDFSFILNNNVSFNNIIDVIRKTCGKNINSIKLFDYFKMDDNQTSIGLNVEFVNFEKTFTDEELKLMSNKIIENCERTLNIKLKGE